MIREFIQGLQKYEIEDITEHTYRKDLEELLQTIAKGVNSKILVQHEPKRIVGIGAPDFKVKLTESIIGYVENKGITKIWIKY
jgi:hypothetical protein